VHQFTVKSKIKILGAGISGLSAAINLATAGYEVEVYERKGDAGARFLGDLQGLENYSEKGNVLDWLSTVNIKPDFYHKALPPLKALDGKGLAADFEFRRPLCYLVKRGVMQDSLDQGLKRQALEGGVRIFFNQKVDPASMDIVAVGTTSKEIFAVDKGIRFETAMPDMAIAIVNDDAAIKGYSYLLVVDGYGCICTVLFDHFHLAEGCYKKTISLLEQTTELDIRNPKKVGGIGSFSLAGNFKMNNQLYVGEAAGLQDLLWGFGIRSAIYSGHLAAKSITEGLDYTDIASSYFQPKLKASMVIRFLYEKIGSYGYAGMLKYTNRKADPIKFLYNAHRFTPVHKLIFPLARYSMRKRYSKLIF
jgi:flavin-dependent dehydrogenase